MKKLQTVWLYILASTTILFAVSYISIQQVLRSSANDPQIQLAEDAAAALNSGKGPSDVAVGVIDMQTSLAPFIVIYDRAGQPVGGNGFLNNKLPEIPYGVLTNAEVGEPNMVTWQPETGLRYASVTAMAKNYYVTSARSLREVEKREDVLLKTMVAGWVVAMVILAAGDYITGRHTRRQGKA